MAQKLKLTEKKLIDFCWKIRVDIWDDYISGCFKYTA